MTQLQVHEEPTLSSESIKSGFEHFMEGFEQFMEGVQTLLTRLAQAYEQAERNYHRAELLTAYRQRTSWKKSDIPRLSTLGINAVARRRMERVTGTGRPVVKSHEDLASVIVRKISSVQALFASQASTSADRRKAFRLSPWWAHCVESMYRGEHALAKACRIADASGQAESPSLMLLKSLLRAFTISVGLSGGCEEKTLTRLTFRPSPWRSSKRG